MKYISLYGKKKESCLGKFKHEDDAIQDKINRYTFGPKRMTVKRDFAHFRPSPIRSQNYFPKLKQEPRLKNNFFKEDEIIQFPQKKLLTEEEKSENGGRPNPMDWDQSLQSESGGNAAEDQEADKHINLSALRSEETLEFKRNPKLRNGEFWEICILLHKLFGVCVNSSSDFSALQYSALY